MKSIKNDTIEQKLDIKPILFASGDEIDYRTLGYLDGVFDKVDSFKTKYSMKDNIYKLENGDSFKINSLSTDSIIIDDGENKILYTKLVPKFIESSFQIGGKSYMFLDRKNNQRHIRLFDDSTYIETSIEEENYSVGRWEWVLFNENVFLLFHNNSITSALHINSINNDEILLKNLGNSKEFKFRLLREEKNCFDSLQGTWTLTDDSSSVPFFPISKFNTIPKNIVFGKDYVKLDNKIAKSSFFLDCNQFVLLNGGFNDFELWNLQKETSDKINLSKYLENQQEKLELTFQKLAN